MTDNVIPLPTASPSEVHNHYLMWPRACRYTGLFGPEKVVITHGLFKGQDGVIKLFAAHRETKHPRRDKRRAALLLKLLKEREARAADRACFTGRADLDKYFHLRPGSVYYVTSILDNPGPGAA